MGGSCVEVEHAGARLVLDLGLPLDAETDGPEQLPAVSGLDGNGADPISGVLISHPHLDHYGLLHHLSPDVPVGMGAAARSILQAAAPFMYKPVPEHEGPTYQDRTPFSIGPFTITPYLVDHSAYDAYALLIEGEGKRLFYTGDIRGHGRKAGLFHALRTNPPEEVDALLMEGSSLKRLDNGARFPTEEDVEGQMAEAFRAAEGLAMVHASAQNIDRIVSILRACKRTGRRFVIDLYTAAVLEATENGNIPQSDWPDVALYVPERQRVQIKKGEWFDLLKRHSANRIFIEDLCREPEKSVLLYRPLHSKDLERAECLDGASYIYSQWEGYWERGSYDAVKDWLAEHGIPKTSIHTSGHASPADLQALVAGLAPKKLVPIHSFNPERYPELFPNVEAHGDGEWWPV